MMEFNNRIRKIFFLFILIELFAFSKVFALETAWPTSPMGTDLTDSSSLTEMVKYFYDWGIAIGGIATFIALLFAGFLYLTSTGDPARLREAKDRIVSAFTGLVLLLGSWLILNTINPELTILRSPSFEPPGIPSPLNLVDLTKQKSCDYVRLYQDPYWKATSTVVNAEEDPGVSCLGSFYPKSVRFLQEISPATERCNTAENKLYIVTIVIQSDGSTTTKDFATDIYCEAKGGKYFREGGSCTLELYTSTYVWVFWTGCGDKIGNTNSSIHNLKLVLEREANIDGVKLTKTGLE